MSQQFDFKAFNNLVNSAGSGLKLHLALGLLKDVDYSFYKYDNTLQPELSGVINELKEVQLKAKAQAADRAARLA